MTTGYSAKVRAWIDLDGERHRNVVKTNHERIVMDGPRVISVGDEFDLTIEVDGEASTRTLRAIRIDGNEVWYVPVEKD